MQDQTSSTPNFAPKNYPLQLGAKLLSFAEDKTFSDICIISSDNVQFHAHKCVLSAFSDYFMVMFTGSLKEAKASSVKIHKVNGNIFKLLLTFMYTGQIKLENDTMEEMFRWAFFFQIHPLIAKCKRFMENNMNAENCLSIANFAIQHDMTELFEKASKFASEHFENVAKYKGFLKLNNNTLLNIVSSADLCVTTEEAVFLNLIKWINYDKPNREKTSFNLISKIRFKQLNADFIKEHRSKLPYQLEYMELVCTWLEYHLSSKNRNDMRGVTIKRPKAGGITFVDRRNKMNLNSFNSNIWTREEASKLPHQFYDIIGVDHEIVFSCEGHCLASFNLYNREIKLLPPMKVPRKGYALAVLEKCIYVVGGYNDKYEWQNVVERFNLHRHIWEDVTPMNNILVSPKATACNNQVYVVGDESLSMECFDSMRSVWTSTSFRRN